MLPLRLRRVSGHDGRANDVLYQPPARVPPHRAPHTLVYFGGDVQDYPEVMQAHRDNKNYVKWNLENTARMLGQLFPTNNIMVVRPSRIEYKSFSCYDNFVPSNNAGVPDHTPTHSALHHLERLLQGVNNRLKSMPTTELLEAVSSITLPEEIDIEDLHNTSIHHGLTDSSTKSNGATKTDVVFQSSSLERAGSTEDIGAGKPEEPLWWLEKLSLDEAPLTLVGFSKGCVVLNQCIYEFHYTKTLTPGDVHTMRFMERIHAMYWLDGGHAGGKNTWITSRSLLETLTRLSRLIVAPRGFFDGGEATANAFRTMLDTIFIEIVGDVSIFVHVSPYQVQDEGRPWIGREEKTFTSMLKKLGANVNRYLHAAPGMPHSLHMHFDVLANFKRMQDSVPPSLPDSSDEEM